MINPDVRSLQQRLNVRLTRTRQGYNVGDTPLILKVGTTTTLVTVYGLPLIRVKNNIDRFQAIIDDPCQVFSSSEMASYIQRLKDLKGIPIQTALKCIGLTPAVFVWNMWKHGVHPSTVGIDDYLSSRVS